MIRINLLGDKVDKSPIHMLQLLLFGFSIVLALMLCVIVHSSASAKETQLASEKTSLDLRLAELKKRTKEVTELEEKKRVLREKLLTIANLKAKKQGPIHVLDEINSAIPERSWLLSAVDKAGTLSITGIALDNQTIAVFISNLKKSKYFETVDLDYSSLQEVESVKMKRFALTVKVTDSLKLRSKSGATEEPKVEGQQTA